MQRTEITSYFSFREMSFSKADYGESGPSIVHKMSLS